MMIDEERDRLWMIDRTAAELYHCSSGKRVQLWNPHSWSYSYGVVYNTSRKWSNTHWVLRSGKNWVSRTATRRE